MRKIRRRLMHTYANLDLPIKWQDPEVETWAKAKNISTRRDCEAIRDINPSDFLNNTRLVSFNEFRWFTSLDYIHNGTFMGCTSLVNITLPNGIRILYGQAFRNCSSLNRLTLPESVRQINGYVFTGCSRLEYVKVLPYSPPVLELSMPSFSGTSCQFYVPDESVEAYVAASGWSDMADRIHALSEWKAG